MTQKGQTKKVLPKQQQRTHPGKEHKMTPKPKAVDHEYKGSGKLMDKVAIITGGDSGIGRAAAVCFAKEGADVAIVYLEEHKDAEETKRMVEKEGRKCLLIAGDIKREKFCQKAVLQAVRTLGGLNILVNNAAVQYPQETIENITEKQIDTTFRTNIYAMFFFVKAALPHMKAKDAIINTTSVTAYRGSNHLLDYASTKGAIVAFTRSLSAALIKTRNIRVNAVAPGPIWTPLIPSSFDAKKVEEFGSDVPMGRPGQPEEVGPCYVFLASDDSSYMTGQVLHPNGGEIVNA